MENDVLETETSSIVEIQQEAFHDDKLNRLQLAEGLKTILLNTTSNVFSINAPWGGGKSYFINNLVKLIGDEAICISYNAWESDFYKNPLIPIVMELLEKIEPLIIEEDELSELFSDLKTAVKSIVDKTSYSIGISSIILSAGLNFDPNKKTTESEYVTLKKLKKEFRDKLLLIQEKLDKKIIIFVDELDRCHPQYAIETLEVIKHFFDIKNIIFVLAVDKKQIENIVKTMYGACDGLGEDFIGGYLRKFIDVELHLPEPEYHEIIAYNLYLLEPSFKTFEDNNKYYDYGSMIIGARVNDVIQEKQLFDRIVELINGLKFQPRDIEKLFLRVKLTIESMNDDDILFIEQIFILNALYMYSKDAFDEYISKPLNNLTTNHIRTVHGIFPYWTDVMRNLSGLINNYDSTIARIEAGSNLANVRCISNRIYKEDINNYLHEYPHKIEFVNILEE